MVTRNFPPLVGGMEKLNLHIFLALKRKFRTYLAGPKGSFNFHSTSPYIEFPFKPLWVYIIASVIKVVFFAGKMRPTIIFCGSGTSVLAGYIAARLCSAKLICYLHGLDIVASNAIYQSLFVPLIKKADLIIVNSGHTGGLAIAAGIKEQRVHLLAPGVAFPEASTKDRLIKNFRKLHGLGERQFILIAGRITARKGIVEFIEKLFVDMVALDQNLTLVIVGEEALDAAKSSQGVTKDINRVISKFGIENNVVLTGGVDEKSFSGALYSAKVLVFPVLNLPNDVEGFGMVAIEAAAHGVPTVGFAVGGVPDAIKNGESGWLIESGDYLEMGRKIFSCIEEGENSTITSASCKAFAGEFEWARFGARLEKIVENLH